MASSDLSGSFTASHGLQIQGFTPALPLADTAPPAPGKPGKRSRERTNRPSHPRRNQQFRLVSSGSDLNDPRVQATWQNALAHAETLLSGLAGRSDFNDILRETFGDGSSEPSTIAPGAAVLGACLKGAGLRLSVQIVGRETLQNKAAAYLARGPLGPECVLINGDWLLSGASAAEIVHTLLEEAGHAIDHRLHPDRDSSGDEGELFARLVTGSPVDEATRQAIQEDQDHGLINLAGINYAAEFGTVSNLPDLDSDGVADATDLDDDNDGILDSVEQLLKGGAPLTPTNLSFKYAQNALGFNSTHNAALAYKTGDRNDPAFFFDGISTTELRVHQNDVYEFVLPRTLGSGSSLSLTEDPSGGYDSKMAVLGSLGSTDAAGNSNNSTGGGQGWDTISGRFGITAVAELETRFLANNGQPLVSSDGKSILFFAGPSNSSITFSSSIAIDHLQIVGLGTHGGWAELSVASEVNTSLDTDGDTIPNHRDLDSDNDGISDLFEVVSSSSDSSLVQADVDRDGRIDSSLTFTASGVWNGLSAGGASSPDRDEDGIPDTLDLDSDGDGIPDTVEARASTSFARNDGDVRNDDSDGDGVIGLFDTKSGFGGSFAVPVNSDSANSGDGTTYQFEGKPSKATVDTGVDNVTLTSLKAALTQGDGTYAKIKETTDLWVLDLGRELPSGAVVTIVVLARRDATAVLNIAQSDSAGNNTSNPQQITFADKDIYYTKTYTLSAATRYIKLNNQIAKEVRIDAVRWGFGTSSTSPIPDYIDLNSENDNLDDRLESGLTLTGVNTVADGIDDGIGASYQDPDGNIATGAGGTVNLTTSGSLRNVDSTAADVDYRSIDADPMIIDNIDVNEASQVAIFTITGRASDTNVKLSLASDSDPTSNDATISGASNLDILQSAVTPTTIQYLNGSTWTNYTAGADVKVSKNSTMLVRVGISNDSPSNYEGPETFRLVATYGTTEAQGGLATIFDDGTGEYWKNTNTTVIPNTTDSGVVLDNDQPVSINNIVINEGSPFGAVFTLDASEGAVLNLSLASTSNTAPIGNATLGTDTGTPLQYSLNGGSTWIDYSWDGSNGNRPTAPASGTVHVRVPIANDTDAEGRETFTLVASRTNGSTTITSTGGLGTIRDDGLGSYWPTKATTPLTAAQLETQAIVLDDDTPIIINNPVANEVSDWIFFDLEGAPNLPFGLALQTTGTGTGHASSGSDFDLVLEYETATGWQPYSSGSILFDSSGHAHVRVAINNDNPAIFEGPETLKLSATSSSGIVSSGGIGTIKDDGTGTVYDADGEDLPNAIRDDDRSITVAGLDAVSEGSNAIFTVSLTGNPDGTTVSLTLGAATDDAESSDYSALSGSTAYYYSGATKTALTISAAGEVTLPAGVTSFFVSTPTTDDADDEGGESFTLAATAYGKSGSDTATILDDGTGKVHDDKGVVDPGATADDDRGITVAGLDAVSEGSNAIFTVSLTGNPDGTTVSLTLGAATDDAESSDYSALSGSTAYYYSGATKTALIISAAGEVTLPAGVTSFFVSTPTTDDGDDEGGESFTLAATAYGKSGSDTATILDDGTGKVHDDKGVVDPGATADDDRGITVAGLDAVSEGSNAIFTVSLTGNPDGTTVSLTLGAATDDAESSDYSALSGSTAYYYSGATKTALTISAAGEVTLPAGVTSFFVSTPTTDDGDDEGGESFTLAATAYGKSGSDTATILDDGTGKVHDDKGVVDPGATADDDRGITVAGLDAVSEGSNAIFTVSLTGNPDGTTVSLTLGAATDDAESSDYSALSGSTAYYYSGATKTALIISAAGEVTLPAGVTSFFVSTPTTDDGDDEGGESFTLAATAYGKSGSDTATILDDGTGKVHDDKGVVDPGATADDDRPVMSVSSVTVSESSPYAVVRVSLSQACTQDVTFTPRLISGSSPSGGNASVGVDTGTSAALQYYNGSAWLSAAAGVTLAAGSTSVLLRTTIGHDTVYEGPESLQISTGAIGGTAPLANPSGASGSITITDNGSSGARFEATNNSETPTTGTPDDDRPVISITPLATVGETQSNTTRLVNFTINLSKPSTTSVTVSYSTSATAPPAPYTMLGDRVATTGLDFQPINNATATFLPGATSLILTTTVVGDDAAEPTESFFITLTGASANARVGDGNSEIAIFDNDGPQGNDLTYDFAAATAAVDVRGGIGNDTLIGSAYHDVLFGDPPTDPSGGDDSIRGNLGADTLTGGPGADGFMYGSFTESTIASLDRIRDFTPGTATNPGGGDRIDLASIPTVLFKRGVISSHNGSSINTLAGAFKAAFEDVSAASGANVPLGADQAVLFAFDSRVSGVTQRQWFLAVNDGTAARSDSSDLLINVSGIAGATSFANTALSAPTITPAHFFS